MAKWSRRRFLGKSFLCTAGLITVSVLPLGLTACNEKDKPKDVSTMANLGPLSELEKGEFPKKVNYKVKVKDAWVTQEQEGFVYINKNKENNKLLIMSPICTHLGCTVGEADKGIKLENTSFLCPCHAGQYDENGINIAGPPPRPFDIFEAYLQDGNVYISIFGGIRREKG
jgi:menaquinol-cytochrome c reductase iron-sulfur subunit